MPKCPSTFLCPLQFLLTVFNCFYYTNFSPLVKFIWRIFFCSCYKCNCFLGFQFREFAFSRQWHYFCLLMFQSTTSLNAFIIPSEVFGVFGAFSIAKIMSSAHSENLNEVLHLFPFSDCSAHGFCYSVNRSGDSGHPHLAPDFREKK